MVVNVKQKIWIIRNFRNSSTALECVHLYKLYEMFFSIQFFSCFVIEWVCWSKSAIWRDVQSLHSHEKGVPTLSTPYSQIKMSVVNVSSISDISRSHFLFNKAEVKIKSPLVCIFSFIPTGYGPSWLL